MTGEVTTWLEQLRSGDERAVSELVPMLYGELRRIASQRLRKERGGHTLQTTALVNEAYLKMSKQKALQPQDRAEFLAIAGQTMRNILVDYARSRSRKKRGGTQEAVPLEEIEEFLTHQEAEELLHLENSLNRLGEINPDGARIVELRFFAGLSLEEIARHTGMSARTARRRWIAARAWLRKEMLPATARDGSVTELLA